MVYLNSIIFGIVQGVTEFLPISSSGHLEVLHFFFELPIENNLLFDVFLHAATLLAVIYFFRRDILMLLKGFVSSFSGNSSQYSKLSWYIIFATAPAAFVGYFASDFIDSNFRDINVVIFMLIFVAILFLIIERYGSKQREISDINIKDSLFIGCAQAIALIPGTSRSGITIIAGLFMDLKREAAIRFSFLMSVPIISGALLKNIVDADSLIFSDIELRIFTLASVSAFFTAIFVIRFFLKFAAKYSLNIFAYYRIALGLFLVVLLRFI